MPGWGYFPISCWPGKPPRTYKPERLFATAVSFMPKLESKTLLLKITLTGERGEEKRELNWKLAPLWLPFSMPEMLGMQAVENCHQHSCLVMDPLC